MSPIQHAPEVGSLIEALVNQPVLAIALAGVLTWVCHSSVAVVLLIFSLVKSGVIAPEAALVLVLGANLGGTVPAFLEAESLTARRLPLGNMLVRAIGCIVAIPFLPFIYTLVARIEPNPARIIVNFHTAFNLALAALFILPIDPIAGWLILLLPDPPPPTDPGVPRYLEQAARGTASVGLVNATRETLRMADMVQTMLEGALAVFRNDDRKLASRISRMDYTLDRLGVAVRRYLADLSGEELNEEDSSRGQEIFTFTINLDYIGDILANILSEFASTKLKRGRSLTLQEFDAIAYMHSQVVESLNLGLAVFMRGDETVARQLVERKRLIWQIEARAAEGYFLRLREVHAQNGGGGDDFYLRILRDLKRVHSLIAALAYPILDRAGQLQNRLVETSDSEQSPETETLGLKP